MPIAQLHRKLLAATFSAIAGASLLSAFGPAVVEAGPNAGGTLIVHAQPELTLTLVESCQASCDCFSLSACDQALTTVGTDRPYYFFVVAAFPAGSAPRLAGVTFGLQYPDGFFISTAAKCAQFELADAGWPGSGTGTALSFGAAETDAMVPIYLFGAQSYYGGLLELTPHPLQGGSFADDSVPSELDPIAAYGALGFDQPGVAVCPSTEVRIGACCYIDALHYLCAPTSAADCATLGGDYRGDDLPCSPWPCDESPRACCLPNGTCSLNSPSGCLQSGGYPALEYRECTFAPCGDYLPAACCLPGGECQVLPEPACYDLGGTWTGISTDCSPDPCTVPGACCLPDGSCVTSTAAECEQLGSDRWLPLECDPNPCPSPGACCLPDGDCVTLLFNLCQSQGGRYLGTNTPCTPDVCSVGACCLADDHICLLRAADQCDAYGGTYLGAGTDCDPNPCYLGGPGACCLPASGCVVLSERDCLDGGGTYLSEGWPCTPDPCGMLGACCYLDGHCELRMEGSCMSDQGAYMGDGVACEPNPCMAPRGACCLADGSCELLTQAGCSSAGGHYLGDGMLCGPNPCPQPMLGACCLPTGACQFVTPSSCEQMNGTYLGDGVPCEPNPCPPDERFGACCYFIDIAPFCIETTPQDCVVNHNGQFQGDGTTCRTDPCELNIGACCTDGGVCTIKPEVLCTYGGWGVFMGEGVTCDPNPCPAGGACCTYGSCEIRYPRNCIASEGSWLGWDTTCDPNPCPNPYGACCFPDGTCEELREDDCAEQWQGADTRCDPNPCLPVATQPASWGQIKARYREAGETR